MAKFITGKDLEDAVYNIIWEAESTLLIVSPFIRLDDYFKKLFDKHINNHKIHFIIVFGKNEGEVSRSLSKNDFDYFKNFMNVSIIYVPNLHAKYYGNEKKGIITSINLYDYSFKNNIEFGVYSEGTFLNKLTTTTDQLAWNTCFQIAEENEAVYIKRPVYEKKLLSALLGRSYIKSDTLHDTTEKFYSRNNTKSKEFKRLNDFPEDVELGSTTAPRPSREEIENKPAEPSPNSWKNKKMGYCIRTGVEIPFNLEKPFSYDAYLRWNELGDLNFAENFCHFSGEHSYGETCARKPILNKNWSKANDSFNLKTNYRK